MKPVTNVAKTTQAAEVKQAEKKLAKAGIVRPKHVPKPAEVGVDADTAPVVQSGFSVFNPQPAKEHQMSKQDAAKAAAAAKPTDEEKKAAAAAKAEKKAQADAEKAEKKAQADKAKAEKQAAAEATAAEKKAARDKAAAEKKELAEKRATEAKERGLSYVGSMLALRDAKNTYVKATNGRLRSTDAVATIFDAVEPAGTVAIAMKALELETNPYSQLNVGQQSMNLRNKLRGAIRAGKVTEAQLVSIRDAGGYTEPVMKARADAEQKAKERADKKAADDAAKAAKAADAAKPKVETEGSAAA
jgi:hypothetical protein